MSAPARRPVEVELLLDARAELGEAPIWDHAKRSLLWVDQLAGTVHRVALDGASETLATVGRRVGCATPRTDGEGLVLATDAAFAALDGAGGFELLAAPQLPPARWFMNDGRCDGCGRFWAGTVGLAADGRAARGAGSLQRLDPDGSVTLAWSGSTLANGLDWSPDARTLYFVDSAGGGIDAFPYDARSGTLGRPSRAIEIGLEMATGFADGMCVDADGAIWTAVWGVGEVRRYTPDGRLDRTLRLPVSRPTSCAFVGERLDVLAITSAWHGLAPAARAAEPHAGGVFCARPGVGGRESHAFG